MSIGLISYGVYIPSYRLKREDIAKFWGKASLPGERAVCNFDEDTITMAVEAGHDCLSSIEEKSIDALFFASTSPPYREKQCASIIASALNLQKDIFVADFANSLRAGTQALQAALNALKANAVKLVAVIVSESRHVAPNSDLAPFFGDGAVALLLGNEEGIASFKGDYSYTEVFTDLWRGENDNFTRIWDPTFSIATGYNNILKEGISRALKKYNSSPKDFAKVATYAPNERELTATFKNMGFDTKSQLQTKVLNSVGNTGCALALMDLVIALEDAKPGEKIFVSSYGDGCDVFILEAKERIGDTKGKRVRFEEHLANALYLPYEKYLRFHQLVTIEPERNLPPQLPLPELWRDQPQMLGFHGGKCRQCGTIHFPIQRVCPVCRSKDDFEEENLSKKRGEVFTYTIDNLSPSPNPPTIRAVVDFDTGRITCIMADQELGETRIGMPVEMTFRKSEAVEGVEKYLWKCRPIRRF